MYKRLAGFCFFCDHTHGGKLTRLILTWQAEISDTLIGVLKYNVNTAFALINSEVALSLQKGWNIGSISVEWLKKKKGQGKQYL